jgi:hypothetical protein
MSIRQDEAAISDPGSVAGSGELLLPATPRQPAKRNPWRILAAALIIVFGFCSVAWLYSIGLTDEKVTEKDFIQYWVIGHQLIHGVNPYDIHAVLSLEQTVGLIGNEPRISLSPPVAFCFFVPLAFVSPKIGFILWAPGQSLSPGWICVCSRPRMPDGRTAQHFSSAWYRAISLSSQVPARTCRRSPASLRFEASIVPCFCRCAAGLGRQPEGLPRPRWIRSRSAWQLWIHTLIRQPGLVSIFPTDA